MNKSFEISITAVFFFLHSTCQAKPKTIDFPDDFVSFYENFRGPAAHPRNETLFPLMCFPFESHEVSEIIDERTRKLSKASFKKHRTLVDLFLSDGRGAVREPEDLGSGIPIYKDAQDFLGKNTDPRHPANIDESYGKNFSYANDRGQISSLFFEKRNGHWCWSGALYFGDALQDAKAYMK